MKMITCNLHFTTIEELTQDLIYVMQKLLPNSQVSIPIAKTWANNLMTLNRKTKICKRFKDDKGYYVEDFGYWIPQEIINKYNYYNNLTIF